MAMIDFRWKMMGRLANNLFQWAYLYSQVRDGVIPNIYLQDEKYFERYKDEIKQILSDGITKIDKVAIHIRRGDYVNNPFYIDLMTTDYYKRAMDMFPGSKFLVFSDDILWCMSQDVFKDCEFSQNHTDEGDMNDMASCVGHIISNSSFSWWGAYLSPHKGLVVAPKQWHPDGIQRTGLPIEWLVI